MLLMNNKLEGTKSGRADDVSIDDEDEVDDIGDNEADDASADDVDEADDILGGILRRPVYIVQCWHWWIAG